KTLAQGRMNRAAVGSFAALRMRRTPCEYFARASEIHRGPRTVRRTGWGDSKGALPPLCRRGGGVHKGGTPSTGSLPCAVFWLLFVRTKSIPGYGGGAPENSLCSP